MNCTLFILPTERKLGIIKSEIRKQYLGLRDNLDRCELLNRSESIYCRLMAVQAVIEARTIMCFVSFGSEVHTHGLIRSWLSQGKRVSVPCLEKHKDGNSRMHAVQIRDFSQLKARGSFGILEPLLAESDIVSPQEHDVIIVPGSVFDENRNRMGYGGGFYDRYLTGTSDRCLNIGLCFDFQVIAHIPHENHDIPLDLIVTEKRII
ncbi:5-formyltetrahydrofolate cyclo-ligase [Ruminiclostridium hungatei]